VRLTGADFADLGLVGGWHLVTSEAKVLTFTLMAAKGRAAILEACKSHAASVCVIWSVTSASSTRSTSSPAFIAFSMSFFVFFNCIKCNIKD
jgi:hypothetical protein